MLMKSVFAAALSVFAAIAVAADAESAVVLSMSGSNTVGQRLAPALARAWAASEGWEFTNEANPAENETVLTFLNNDDPVEIRMAAHGTSTGLSALASGEADLWMASRPVQPGEVQAHAQQIGRLDHPEQEQVIALDGLAIIVHPRSVLTALSLDRLRLIFSGSIRTWQEIGIAGGKINLYARDDKSGTFDTFKSLVLNGAALSADARRFESTEALAAEVANDPSGIGFVGLAGIGKTRAVAISGKETAAMLPSALGIATEDYPLSRRLMLYARQEKSPATTRFLTFVQSRAGQELVRQVGFVGQEMRLHAVETPRAAPTEFAELVNGAQRLSVNLRFGSGVTYLDSKATLDLDRIAEFLRGFDRNSREVILLGYSDRREHNPVLALHMSNDRADYVATELAERGITVNRSRGMGQVLAVADNDSDLGRSRNRRVEIWVRPLKQRIVGAVVGSAHSESAH